MNPVSGASIYGDAEARRRRTLDAALALLDEGGYNALTIRAVAKRSGTSTGLIYQYFIDKQDLFAALLTESQLELAEFATRLSRQRGLEPLIVEMIHEFVRHWARVGRLTTSWRDMGGVAGSERESRRELHAAVKVYNLELVDALTEAAAVDGKELLESPALVHLVLSSLKGLSDTMVGDMAKEIDPTTLVELSARTLARAITVDRAPHLTGVDLGLLHE